MEIKQQLCYDCSIYHLMGLLRIVALTFSLLYFRIISRVIREMAGWKYVCSASTMMRTSSSAAIWQQKIKTFSSFTVNMEAAGYPITLIPIKLHSVISKKIIILKIRVGITHAFIIHIFSHLLFYFSHEIHHYPTQSYSEAAMHGYWIMCAGSWHVTSRPAPRSVKFTHFQCLWWLPVSWSPDTASCLYFQNEITLQNALI